MTSINHTLNYELARRKGMVMGFSALVTTASTYLNGSGGQAGDGFPLPVSGRLLKMSCWDGVLSIDAAGSLELAAGDRISVYAAANAQAFDVTLRKNGVNTSIVCSGAVQNTTLWVTVLLQLD